MVLSQLIVFGKLVAFVILCVIGLYVKLVIRILYAYVVCNGDVE